MIRGEKINLEAVEPDDVKEYHHWINDEETNEWRGLYHPTSQAETSTWINEQIEKRTDRLTLSIKAPLKKDSLESIGFIGLRGICARSRRAELWIYIGNKKAWGKAFGQDAIRSLCTYAFEEMNLFRIWMECDPKYKAALKCYKNVGFIKEGLHRKAYYRRGKFRDTCTMALLRTDWKGTKKSK